MRTCCRLNTRSGHWLTRCSTSGHNVSRHLHDKALGECWQNCSLHDDPVLETVSNRNTNHFNNSSNSSSPLPLPPQPNTKKPLANTEKARSHHRSPTFAGKCFLTWLIVSAWYAAVGLSELGRKWGTASVITSTRRPCRAVREKRGDVPVASSASCHRTEARTTAASIAMLV